VRLHEERYIIPDATADAIASAYESKRRIIAVGTTAARTLEGAVLKHCESLGTGPFEGKLSPQAREGTTNIFISPGHKFALVNGLLTNFHLPQSTLLMLVSAFAGREVVLAAYAHAVRERYRFFSYGDCMLIL
jgi:S-adenosylmethionine:tRNA ribosyltransferase-isomerase